MENMMFCKKEKENREDITFKKLNSRKIFNWSSEYTKTFSLFKEKYHLFDHSFVAFDDLTSGLYPNICEMGRVKSWERWVKNVTGLLPGMWHECYSLQQQARLCFRLVSYIGYKLLESNVLKTRKFWLFQCLVC